jgi:subtilisin family serine protease
MTGTTRAATAALRMVRGGLVVILAILSPAARLRAEDVLPPPTPEQRAAAFADLGEKARKDGTVPAMVRVAAPFVAEGDLPDPTSVERQRAAIAAAQQRLEAVLTDRGVKLKRRFRYIPYVAVRLDPDSLAYLERRSEVVTVDEDALARPDLASTSQIVGTPLAHAYRYNGGGQAIAILDSGVDRDHPFLGGRIIEEGCFSSGGFGAESLCPDGSSEQTGGGAGDNCPLSIDGCDHGTHVAGIAAGRGNEPGDTPSAALPDFSGVAPWASLISVQVFHREEGSVCASNGDLSPCVRAFTSDWVAALEFVYDLRDEHAIASVNLSLGGGGFTREDDCASANGSVVAAVDNLRSARIATVASSGNDGFTDRLEAPACIRHVVSVGRTNDSDTVASTSNSASFLDLLAPGSDVDSSVPGGGFASKSGTSMAAPHVAGAWALLKQAFGNIAVSTVLNKLRDAGVAVTDSRNGITKPRLRIDAALPIEAVILSASPRLRTINTSQTALYTINIARVNYDGPVDLQLDWMPPSITATLDGVPVTGGTVVPTSGSALLRLQPQVSSAALGVKTFTVKPVNLEGSPDFFSTDVQVDVRPLLPLVTSFSPASGPIGTRVTLFGSNLIGLHVDFGGIATSVQEISATEVRVTVPAGVVTGGVPIHFGNAAGSRLAPTFFTVTPGPSVTGLSPLGGVEGDPVTISGFNFTGATAVKFGGVSASFTVLSATKIQTTVPVGAVSGQVRVTTPLGSDLSSSSFTVESATAPPSISGFTPATGDVGTEVTLNGRGFVGTVLVRFNGRIAVEVTRISSHQLKVKVPSGATTGRITVSTPNGTATSATDFTRIVI